jgi:CBS domain-containing protein
VKIRQIIEGKGSEVVSVRPDDSLATAVVSMTDNGVGSALAIDESGRIMGVLTERDVLRYCSDLICPLSETKVSEIMTTDVMVAIPDDDVETMIATMVEGRFRHLPVVDDGKLRGLVSMGDLVKSQLKHVRVENRHLKDYIEGKYPGEAIRK